LEKLNIIITKDQIEQKVRDLGALISSDYDEEEIILICNLKGAFIFLADLCRNITSPISTDFIATTGKNILLVEDIIDSGFTVEYILSYLSLHKPKSVKICAFLDKKCMRKVDIPIDYIGFEVGDRFLVGYGLDYNERYRELDYIAELIEP
jgi:hypoxanthine phosphoribosyltransferase